MKREKVDIILYKIREFLNKNEKFKNLNIHAVFINENVKNDGIALTFDKEFEYGVKINLKDYSYSYMNNMDFDFDKDIFEELEKGKSVVFISDEQNYNIWTNIYAMGIEQIECKVGWQKYLQYCIDKKIDKEEYMKDFKDMKKIMKQEKIKLKGKER